MKNFFINKATILNKKSSTFIIAEVGINHEGNGDLAYNLFKEAFAAGADAVKIQIVDPDSSYSNDTESYRLFKKAILDERVIMGLKNYFKRKLVFATPGDIKSLEQCERLNFPLYKISSGLMTNIPLIKEVKSKGKPIIISTGMATKNDIDRCETLFSNDYSMLSLLHCTSLYPANKKYLNLDKISYLNNQYNCLIGYSDHSLSWEASTTSVALGAKIIEKHFTIDNKRKGYDHGISLGPSDFKSMVKSIRDVEKMLGSAALSPTMQELENKEKIMRYCFASKVIDKGDLFSIQNVSFKRVLNSNKILPAYKFDFIEGTKSKKLYVQGDPIIK